MSASPALGVWAGVGALTLLSGGALVVAVGALRAERRRRAVLDRLAPSGAAGARGPRDGAAGQVLREAPTDALGRLAAWLGAWLPDALLARAAAAPLVAAGFDGAAAPALFAAAWVVSAVAVPLLAAGFVGGGTLIDVVALGVGVAAGVALPRAALDRLVAGRQARLRRALPDALDLLVVCLEAGVSLDAAMLRVSRDLERTHPELARELGAVNGRVSAGLPREEALRSLHVRTGLDELRSLASTMVQGERWGTSLSRVLRIQAETMRTRRRQHAERRAAEASVKMIVPLVVFLLPAFFAVVLGPAVLTMMDLFKGGGP